ncbi:MAG: response regulator transcription factor [Acidimicrobiales bacterium]|nr:response regulator transcription factor [Acidimicrobiales bacterium]
MIQPNLEQGSPRCTVLLVDDHEILTMGMAAYLRSDGFAVETLNPSCPDDVLSHPVVTQGGVVISDLQMPAIPDVFELIATLTARRVRVVALTGSTDALTTGRALRAGAVLLVQKSEPLDGLAQLLQAVAEGRPVRTGEREVRLSDLRHLERTERETFAVFELLTNRETAILFHLMAGRSASAIADQDYVSLATVRAQIRAILAKLGANSQLEAVAMANRVGFEPRQVA